MKHGSIVMTVCTIVCVSSSLLVLHVRGPGGDLGGRGVRAALRDHPRDGVAVPATRET